MSIFIDFLPCHVSSNLSNVDEFFWSNILSNDPGEVDSNFFCYLTTVLSPHRNVLIFTQRMHKPTGRPFTQ